MTAARAATLGWLGIPLLLYVVPLSLGYGWSSLTPGTPNEPGFEYHGRMPDVPTTVEEFGTGVVVVPLQARMRSYTQSAQLPLWNPYQGLGQPFAAQGEGGPYFPVAIFRAVLPYSWGNWVTVGMLYLAGLTTYALVRGLGGSREAGMLAGMAYELSGAVSLHIARPNIADQMSMLPVLFWAAERALRRGTAGAYAVLALMAGLQLLAGFIQVAVLAAALLVPFILLYAWAVHTGPGRRVRASLLGLGAFGLGNGLAAFFLIPVAEAIRVGVNIRAELAGFLAPPQANGIAFVLPTLFGPFFQSWIPGKQGEVVDWNNLYAYAGFGPVVLVLVGWAMGFQTCRRRTAIAFAFFSLAGGFLFLRYLEFPPAAALNMLPVLGRQTPKHANGVTAFCLLVAAGLALDQVRARPEARLRWWVAGTGAVLGASVVGLIGQRGGFEGLNATLGRTYVLATGVVAGTVLLGVWAARRWRRLGQGGAAAVVIGGVVGELSVYVPLGNSGDSVLAARLVLLWLIAAAALLVALGRRGAAAGFLATGVVAYGLVVAVPSSGLPRRVEVDQPPPFMRWLRAQAGEQYRSFGIAPDFSSVGAIQDIGVVGPLAPPDFSSFVDLISTPAVAAHYRLIGTFWVTIGIPVQDYYDLGQYPKAKPVLDWAGVRYLVLDRAFFHPGGRTDDQALLAPGSGLEVAYEDTSVRILQSAAARTKAEFWDSAQAYAEPASIVTELQRNPAEILGPPKLDTSAASLLPSAGANEPRPVNLDSYQPNQVQLSLEAPSAGIVVLKDAYYPGWQAWVDGQPTDVLRVNGFARGVLIPGAGRHAVLLAYRPASFVRGLLLASAVALLLVVTLVSNHVRRTAQVPWWSMLMGALLLAALMAITVQAYFGATAA